MSFQRAFEKTVGFEGGFGKDPHDKGNWTGGRVGVGVLKGTKYGISSAQYPDMNIEHLTIMGAMGIYERDYWDKLFLDLLPESQTQDEIFDTAVNMGRRVAVQICQEACNFLADNLMVDGIMGSATLNRLQYWIEKDERALLVCLNGYQFIRYTGIVHENNDLLRYARGWTKRVSLYQA